MAEWCSQQVTTAKACNPCHHFHQAQRTQSNHCWPPCPCSLSFYMDSPPRMLLSGLKLWSDLSQRPHKFSPAEANLELGWDSMELLQGSPPRIPAFWNGVEGGACDQGLVFMGGRAVGWGGGIWAVKRWASVSPINSAVMMDVPIWKLLSRCWAPKAISLLLYWTRASWPWATV